MQRHEPAVPHLDAAHNLARWLTRTPEDAEDYLYAFCQNCYHLRDWVLAEFSQATVDSFLKDSLSLRICRGSPRLCFSSSSTRTTRTPPSEVSTSIARHSRV